MVIHASRSHGSAQITPPVARVVLPSRQPTKEQPNAESPPHGGPGRLRGVQQGEGRAIPPLTATVLHAAALWIWHVPFLYEATLRNDYLHGVEHFSFFITAALFWWALIHGRYGRIGYGIAVFYVFVTTMHSGALGALMTFSSRVWYPYYQRAGLQWGIDPVQDQQLAGLIMWVPAGLILVVLGLSLFAMWLGEAEKRIAINEKG